MEITEELLKNIRREDYTKLTLDELKEIHGKVSERLYNLSITRHEADEEKKFSSSCEYLGLQTILKNIINIIDRNSCRDINGTLVINNNEYLIEDGIVIDDKKPLNLYLDGM